VKHITNVPEMIPPAVDESWWAALLSDEERYTVLDSTSTVVLTPERSEQTTAQSSGTRVGETNRAGETNWELVEQLFEQDETICLDATGYNRGGLLVSNPDMHGFVPISHLIDISPDLPETERNQALAKYVGTTLCLKIIECAPERGRVVFSQRAALAGAGKRNLLFDHLSPDIHVWGVVTNVTDFGVFVDLGGLEGLVHVSELSWGRVRHPSDVAQVGKHIETLIISIDKERGRVALSLKRLRSNPWETAEQRYLPGQELDAVVTSIVSFGAFARLEEGLDGLIHVSALCNDGHTTTPWQVLREGETVRVQILSVDASKQRLGLGLCGTVVA